MGCGDVHIPPGPTGFPVRHLRGLCERKNHGNAHSRFKTDPSGYVSFRHLRWGIDVRLRHRDGRVPPAWRLFGDSRAAVLCGDDLGRVQRHASGDLLFNRRSWRQDRPGNVSPHVFVASPLPCAMKPGCLQRAIGQVAYAYGACLRVEVLENVEGFYIGTREDDLPFSRESVEYYPSRAAAERALKGGTWTQRRLPAYDDLSDVQGSFSLCCYRSACPLRSSGETASWHQGRGDRHHGRPRHEPDTDCDSSFQGCPAHAPSLQRGKLLPQLP